MKETNGNKDLMMKHDKMHRNKSSRVKNAEMTLVNRLTKKSTIDKKSTYEKNDVICNLFSMQYGQYNQVNGM